MEKSLAGRGPEDQRVSTEPDPGHDGVATELRWSYNNDGVVQQQQGGLMVGSAMVGGSGMVGSPLSLSFLTVSPCALVYVSVVYMPVAFLHA